MNSGSSTVGGGRTANSQRLFQFYFRMLRNRNNLLRLFAAVRHKTLQHKPALAWETVTLRQKLRWDGILHHLTHSSTQQHHRQLFFIKLFSSLSQIKNIFHFTKEPGLHHVHKKVPSLFLSISPSNLHQIQKGRSVLKSARPEDFNTDLTFDIWTSRS